MDDRDVVAAELASSWFGSGLSVHARTRLAELSSLRHLPAGATLLHEGDETGVFAIVASGRVALRMLVPERGPITILTVEPGDVVGWSAIVVPHRSTSTAVAVEDTTLVAWDARPLRELLRTDLALAATIYPRLLEAVGRRLSATRHQLLDLYRADVEAVPW